jgi:DNA (cytosine-5)-methyltransferase 1
VELADYGVPQRRRRLITVLSRDPLARRRFEAGTSFVPPRTHSAEGGAAGGLAPWVAVTDALAAFPRLDAAGAASASCEAVPFHRVPVLEPKKYEWLRHTPPGRSAFDNQCVAPACGFQGNRTHGAGRGADGINRARRDTPLYCARCGALLPRPYAEAAGGGRRIMSGYTSAYKRMDGGLPAPALTRNLSYPCSDQKVHPTQNRVLSLAEAMTLHTIDRYPYRWGPLRQGRRERDVAPDSLIRLVIGESVPPLFFELLGRHLASLSYPLPEVRFCPCSRDAQRSASSPPA